MRHDGDAERLVLHASRALRRVCNAALGGIALVAVSALCSTAGAQISPGPLAKAHAALEGPLSCAKCHGGGKEGMTTRCLACHREIAWLVDQGRGYHARIPKAECASCHPDHAGRDFNLVKWPDGSARQFDHTRAGFGLDGKHAQITCEKCHTPELRVSQAADLGPRRTTAAFTGLETSCASCHRDVHQGTLSRSCENCHNTTAWSPAPKFDHARSRYPLTGKHADVACAKCHTTAAGAEMKLAVARFKPLPHADCVACHRDPHAGRLRGACSSCHVTTSFSAIGGRNFSHDRTRYPLLGRHALVSCDLCHAEYPKRIDRPAFASCTSCHIDYHRGQARVAGVVVDCAYCHSVAGFTPATFTVAQHTRTGYPLVGKHATVSCASCHMRRDARGALALVMRPASNRCEVCHVDAPHGAQLVALGTKGACTACHTPSGWKPALFGVREHAALRFPLTGRHASTSCASCHSAKRQGLPPFPATRSLGSAQVALHLDEITCDGCHRDPHGSKYRPARPPVQGTCAACHDTRAFHPSAVDAAVHATFAFTLEGAHRAAPCVACHTAMGTGSSLGASLKLSPAPARPLVYTLPGATCATCHRSPHGNQFASRKDNGACQSCHDLRGWAPASRFVHDANGGFTLGPAHEHLACARCHLPPASDKAVRTWRGVPRNCEACHTNGVRRS